MKRPCAGTSPTPPPTASTPQVHNKAPYAMQVTWVANVGTVVSDEIQRVQHG